MTPEQLLFSESHEWVRVETDADGTKVATVGLSAYATEALPDMVFIDLPEVGREISAGESFSEVESVKGVNDIYSPVEGQVVEVNDAIAEKLEIVADDPYGAGWFVKIRIADESGLAKLLDHAAYKKMCEEDASA